MDKFTCVKNYIEATKAYYLFMMGNFYNVGEWRDCILDSKYLSGAKVSFISNIMLGMKEDIVENCGELVYESKLFVNSLEKAVSRIATYNGVSYEIDGFIFPDAPTAVAIVRNKLAHGKYVIDFDNNKIILKHKGQDIAIDIDKLINFVMVGFMNMLKEQKNTQYEREVCVFNPKESIKKKKLIVLSDVRNVIKNIHLVTFKLSSSLGKVISQDAIKVLEEFISYYRISPKDTLRSDLYKWTNNYFRKNGYELSVHSKSVSNRDAIDDISKIFEEQFKNLDLDYFEQVKLIASEVQRRLSDKYNNFNPMVANINHLIILQGISKTKSTDFNTLSKYVNDMGIDSLKFHYDAFGISLISMFNSLFLYPLEDVFVIGGGYKLDRSLEFDFASLDLSTIKPSKISINDSIRDMSYQKYNSLLKKKNEINEKIEIQKSNLKKVNENQKAISAINNNVSALQKLYSLVACDLINAKLEYDNIDKDFKDNSEYFRNVSIIEGIRNAIAHGNYKFVGNSDIMKTKIVFEDIYEGELTFKLEVTFNDFIEFLENNLRIIVQYVDNKNTLFKKSPLDKK